MNDFGCVPESVWALCGTIDSARRNRLLHPPPYEKIIEELIDTARVVEIHKQRAPEGQSGHRCAVMFGIKPRMLDQFFNSACGYRAQYLLDPEQGDRANRYVIDKALPKLLRAATDNHAYQQFVEYSLAHCWAKVWIYQGLWLRRARREHRILFVPAWQRHLESQGKRCKKLIQWGALAPDSESRLMFKGGYVLSSTELWIGKEHATRACEIHDFGFT